MQTELFSSRLRPLRLPALVALACFLMPSFAAAADLAYQKPEPTLVDIIDAPGPLISMVSPDEERVLLLSSPPLIPIAELAERELRLAGLRINPRIHARSRQPFVDDMRILEIASGEERPVSGLPESPRIQNPRMSPDGSHVAFTLTAEEGIELWVADVATATARRLSDRHLSMVSGIRPGFSPDGLSLLVALVPEDLGAEPEAARVPKGPVVQENLGSTSPARTYQDLLAGPDDERLFEHHLTSQLARVDLDGKVTLLGEPDLYWDARLSPNGAYLVVETLHRPFSYLVPATRFPRRIEVWNREGEVVHQVADLPLQEGVPIAFGSVPTGPRDVSWRSDAPATLYWAEALDGGDAGTEADERDALLTLASPFEAEPRRLATLPLRFAGVTWGDDDLALVTEFWWKTRKLRVSRLRPDEAGTKPEVIIDRSFEDRYSDPGQPLTETNRWGWEVLKTDPTGEHLYMVGSGASPEGDRPFLDVFDLSTRETRRLFHSEAPYYSRPLALFGGEDGRVLLQKESVTEPPNLFLVPLAGGEARRLTSVPHPTPQLQGVGKELIRYDRADGVRLTGTLYTPPGWTKEDGPLPVLMWAYPQEFKSADAAGQVTDSPYRFDRLGWWSPVLWVTQGYAVLDNPSLPIIGEGDVEPNDTYVDQLVAGAKAAVDELERRGVGDPRRIAIGGHSYGAFMTANLLAHSDLFAAGIAQSGAYNRTLTPFGFQSEERTVWEAPDIYVTMSPFMHADKVNEPLLMIHGEADNNSGTYPMQSERFYAALKGLGGTVRLVMLPHESHGYRSRESILHTLWEKSRWLETYVKNRSTKAAGGEGGDDGRESGEDR